MSDKIETTAEDVGMILQNSAQNLMHEPTDSALVADLDAETSRGIPACVLYVLAFDSHKVAIAVANEAQRMSDSRRGLRAHVCTGHGRFRRLSVVTLIQPLP